MSQMQGDPKKAVLLIGGVIFVIVLFFSAPWLFFLLLFVGPPLWKEYQKRYGGGGGSVLSSIQDYFTNKKNMNVQDAEVVGAKMVGGIGRMIRNVAIGIVAIWILVSSIVIVDAGRTGVYSLFGKVGDAELSSGIHLINPLAKVEMMSVRTEQYTMSKVPMEGQKASDDSIASLTKEGLSVELDITMLFRVDEQKASDLYREVGVNFEEKIIRPEIRSVIREVIAQYEAKDIYSDKRQEAAQMIFSLMAEKLAARGVVLEDVLLRNVELPKNLATAIQEKLASEQESQRYDFVLQKEAKEAERKTIEAKGQRDAQQIINESLSDRYLNYLYIKELKDRQGTIYVPTSPTTGIPLFKGIGQ
jgi:regulator of protease activity HflC (stomatin/prohibitin superfamily)